MLAVTPRDYAGHRQIVAAEGHQLIKGQVASALDQRPVGGQVAELHRLCAVWQPQGRGKKHF